MREDHCGQGPRFHLSDCHSASLPLEDSPLPCLLLTLVWRSRELGRFSPSTGCLGVREEPWPGAWTVGGDVGTHLASIRLNKSSASFTPQAFNVLDPPICQPFQESCGTGSLAFYCCHSPNQRQTTTLDAETHLPRLFTHSPAPTGVLASLFCCCLSPFSQSSRFTSFHFPFFKNSF